MVPAMIRVLFVCSDNAVRSLMAEACLREIADDHFEAHSAGIRAAELHPLTRVVLAESGIGTRELRSKQVEQYFGASWDYVISLGEEAGHDPVLAIVAGEARRLHWEIEDPTRVPGLTARLRAFRASRDAIRRRVESLVASIDPLSSRDLIGAGA
jgi:protein-tyrosine-phosphatase